MEEDDRDSSKVMAHSEIQWMDLEENWKNTHCQETEDYVHPEIELLMQTKPAIELLMQTKPALEILPYKLDYKD